jgi:hypothetical protein
MSKVVKPILNIATLGLYGAVTGEDQMKAPDLAPLPPVPTTASQPVVDAAQTEREKLAKIMRGRAGLILTSGQGALDTAPVGKTLLLGGGA